MAFADAIRTTTPDFSDVADLLEDLLIDNSDQDGSASITSYSGGTYAVITSMDVTVNVVTGQRVLVMASLVMSASDTSTTASLQIHENTVAAGVGQILSSASFVGATAGQSFVMHTQFLFTAPSTGSVTYDLRWRVSGGAGTLYADNRSFIVIPFRVS